MVGRVLFSLWFRLVVGFALVLALTLFGVSLYLNRVAASEAVRLEQDIDEVRAARIEEVVSRYIQGRSRRVGLQGTLEHAGWLYGWRITVHDRDGTPLADSHVMVTRQATGPAVTRKSMPIMDEGQEVASLVMESLHEPAGGAEPTASRMAASVNRALVYTGIGGALGGIALITLVSGRILGPVHRLRSAARRLGRGDLSQRVPSPGQDEIGELGRSFNTMAEALERAEQQRRSMIADVAHELRTPLSNIRGYLEAVKDGLVEPTPETIDTIADQASLLSHLVEDLRVLALAEAGSLRLDLQRISLEPILRAAAESFGPRAQAKGVDLTLDTAPDLPLVNADAARIAQVTGNLIENAVFQTPEGGSVRLSAETEESRVRVAVEDTGPGIEPEDLERIFDRFYRVDPSRTRATGGAGLGLTIAKQLVEAHGGVIYAQSSLAGGSRFVFELPAAPAPLDGGDAAD